MTSNTLLLVLVGALVLCCALPMLMGRRRQGRDKQKPPGAGGH